MSSVTRIALIPSRQCPELDIEVVDMGLHGTAGLPLELLDRRLNIIEYRHYVVPFRDF